MRSTSSFPSTAATAVFLLGALTALAPPPDMLAPGPLGLKMVLRRLVAVAGSACLGGAGGGGTENKARSCSSVSLIRLVMSWFWSSALVKILGGANLGVFSAHPKGRSDARTATRQWMQHRARSAPGARPGASWRALGRLHRLAGVNNDATSRRSHYFSPSSSPRQ